MHPAVLCPPPHTNSAYYRGTSPRVLVEISKTFVFSSLRPKCSHRMYWSDIEKTCGRLHGNRRRTRRDLVRRNVYSDQRCPSLFEYLICLVVETAFCGRSNKNRFSMVCTRGKRRRRRRVHGRTVSPIGRRRSSRVWAPPRLITRNDF